MDSLARQDEILGASRRFAETEAAHLQAKYARKGLAPGKWHTFDCHECGRDGRSPLVVSDKDEAVCPRCRRAMVRNGSDAA